MTGSRCFQLLLLPVLLAFPVSRAQAQAAPAYAPAQWKAEIFGGYSRVSVRPGRDLDRRSLQGWAFAFTDYQFFSRWGLAVEVGGNRDDRARHYSYLVGGTYRGLQRKRIALTGRILAGVTRWNPRELTADAYRQQTAFTFGFGQSIDFKFSGNLALRVQPDLRFVRFKQPGGSAGLSLLTPISAGLVYQFGRR